MLRRLSCFVLLALAVAAFPVQSQTVNAALSQCLSVFGAVERLACYDRVARSVTGPAPVPAAPAMAPRAQTIAPPINHMGEEQLGAEQVSPPPGSPPRLSSLTSAVSGYKLDTNGKFIISLANGQVWRQLEGDTLETIPKSRTVRISRGILGSYNLTFLGSKVEFKVARLR